MTQIDPENPGAFLAAMFTKDLGGASGHDLKGSAFLDGSRSRPAIIKNLDADIHVTKAAELPLIKNLLNEHAERNDTDLPRFMSYDLVVQAIEKRPPPLC